MLKAEIIKKEAEGKGEVDENTLIVLLKTMKKQREEVIPQYEEAGRAELAEKERAELAIIESYLPSELSEEELNKMVTEAIAEAGATDAKAMGNVMKIVMAKAGGRADGKRVSAMVKAALIQ